MARKLKDDAHALLRELVETPNACDVPFGSSTAELWAKLGPDVLEKQFGADEIFTQEQIVKMARAFILLAHETGHIPIDTLKHIVDHPDYLRACIVDKLMAAREFQECSKPKGQRQRITVELIIGEIWDENTHRELFPLKDSPKNLAQSVARGRRMTRDLKQRLIDEDKINRVKRVGD